jgi:heptosyltransferase-3
MRLLFIKLKHIGDSLLLTPTLTAARARHPDAEIWVVVRRGCEGILEGCPAIDRVVTAAPPERSQRSLRDLWRGVRLLLELRGRRFDYAFELSDGDRGRFLAWLSGARHRCTNVAAEPLSRWWQGRFNQVSHYDWLPHHRVEKDFHTVADFIPMPPSIPPLTFVRERTTGWDPSNQFGAFALMHPGTRWARKSWPVEHWIRTGAAIASRGLRVVVSCGPAAAEAELAGEIARGIGSAAVSTQGRLSWAQLAGLLHRARLFVGVDTAAMHLAAACQCPTVALFGPSTLHEWSPWQVAHRIVTLSPETRKTLPAAEWTRAIPPEGVIQAAVSLLESPPPQNRH